MKLEQVLAALGIQYNPGENFDQIVRGPNVWPLIIDRDTAIKAIQYGCEKGPPFIVVRTIRSAFKSVDVEYPQQIWYKIGSTSHQQDMGFDLPVGISGFPKHICIESTLAEVLIAEGLLWIHGASEDEQTHCYYTGPGSYFETHRARLESYAELRNAERSRLAS